MKRRLPLSLAFVGALILAGCIDDFTVTQSPLQTPGGTAASSVPDTNFGGPSATVLGAERDMKVTRLSGPNHVLADVTNGLLTFTTEAGTSGELEVQWDGSDNDPQKLNPTGLGGADLTCDDGAPCPSDTFQVTVNAATAGAVLIMEVFTDGGDSSVRSLVLPAVSAPRSFYLPYASFQANRGTGAVFTNAGAVRLFLRGGPSTQAVLDSVFEVEGVPTVTATLTDNAASAVPGATLHYSATIGNDNGTALGTSFTDTLDANTTLVAGTIKVSPIALDDNYTTKTTTPASPLTVVTANGLRANDRDPDGLPAALTVTVPSLSTSRGGSLTVNTDGAFTYTPLAGSEGYPDTFAYTITDADGLTDTAVATITIEDDAPTVVSTVPVPAATHVVASANLSVTFSEPVAATTSSFTIDCGSGPLAYGLSSSPATTFTLDPAADLPDGAACTVTVVANQISDVDTNDPPDGLIADASFGFTTEARPVVTTSGGTTAFVEDAGPVVVDAGVSVTDADSANLTGATVAITNVLDSGKETLAANTAGTAITASAPGTSLTLSGTDTVAHYQQVLRTITYNDSSDTPDPTVRVVSFTATDGSLTSAAATQNVSVTAADDAPVLAGTGTVSYTEDGPATAIAPGITVSDVDSPNLTSAFVGISSNWGGPTDVLAADTTGTSITAVFSSGTGDLTLSGADTLAAYQQVLRTVTFSTTSDAPSTASRGIDIKVNDGTLDSANASVTVTVTAHDDPPVNTVPGPQSVNEDTDLTFSGSIAVADPDAGTSAVDVSLSATNGTLTLSGVAGLSFPAGANGTSLFTARGTLVDLNAALSGLKYRGTLNYSGGDTITITTNDRGFTGTGGPLSDTDTIGVTVDPVNDPPVLTAGATLAYTENDPATAIDGTITVGDVDSGSLAAAQVSISANYVNGEDVLSFTNQLGITGTWDVPSGVLTLTGVAPLADYQTALRTVAYANTSDNPSALARTISWQGNDGNASFNLSSVVTSTVNVTPVNDAPVVTASGGNADFYAQAGAVVVDPNVAASDVDSPTLASATVKITNVKDAGFETLVADVTGTTITTSYTAPTLTLSGTDTVAHYQQVLRTVTYEDTAGANPDLTTRVVEFKVNDGSLDSAPSTRDVHMHLDDPPVVTTSGGTTAYTENGAPLTIDGAVTVTDTDNLNLAGATVSITGNFASAEDVLGFTNQSGITGSYSAGIGVMTLSGTATVAAYQSALQSVTYSNSSDNPSTATRTLSFQASDGIRLSNVGTKQLSVTAVNDAPVVTTSGGTTAYTENGAPLPIDAALTVTDPDNANLTGATVSITGNFVTGQDVLSFTPQGGISGSYNSSTGVLTLSGTVSVAAYQTALRTVAYSNSSENPSALTRTVTFVVTDGALPSAAATRAVSVTSVDDAPVAVADSGYSVNEGGTLSVPVGTGVLANDSDVDNVSFTAVLVSGPAHATSFTLNPNGSFTYTHDGSETTSDSFTYKANDGILDSNTVTASITVTPVNDAPVVTLSGGASTFTEQAGAIVVDSGLTVTDADNPTLASATVKIAIVVDSGFETLAADITGTSITTAYNTLTGTLTLSGTDTVAHYQQVLRTVTYNDTTDNPTNFGGNATRSITFKVNDGALDSNNPGKSITVVDVDDNPVLGGGGATDAYTENGAASPIDLTVTVSDIDDQNMSGATVTISANYQGGGKDVLSFTNQNGISGSWNPGTGVMTLSGASSKANYQTALGSVKYSSTSEDPSTLDRTVTWKVTDARSGASNTATSTITVLNVNDPPTAKAYAVAQALQALAGIPVSFPAGTLSGTDQADEVANGSTVSIDTTSVGNLTNLAAVSLNADGSFTVTPAAGATGAASFTYKVIDTGNPAPGVTSAAATVNVNLNGPSTYFVKAGGTGSCSLGNECAIGTAQTSIASNLNRHIFLTDANTHSPSGGQILLNTGGWIVGRGVADVDFATAMGYNAAITTVTGAGGTIVGALPSINQPLGNRPILAGNVTLANNSNVRGLKLSIGNGDGLTASANTGLVVSEVDITTNANLSILFAVNFTTSSGNFSFGNITVNPGQAGSGIKLANMGAANLSFGNVSTQSSTAVNISGGTGVVSFGNVSTTTGIPVTVSSRTGGSVTFTGLVTGTTSGGQGISLGSNTGSTITFKGGISLSTAANAAFTATGGGTVNVCDRTDCTVGVANVTNTLATTTGTALNVANTAIGANGLRFRSIASNGAGSANGIILDTTGALGGLTVTGTGTAASGGTISSKTGTDGSAATQGTGIYLNATSNVSLAYMDIEGCQNYGIRGLSVSGFTLDNSTIGVTAKNGTSITADSTPVTLVTGEGSVRFYNLTGTAAITNSTLDNGFSRTILIGNDVVATLSLVITNSTIMESLNNSNGGDTSGGTSDAMFLDLIGSGTISTTVTNSHFTAYRQFAIQSRTGDTAVQNMTVSGSDFSNSNAGNVSASGSISIGSDGTDSLVTFDIHNNTFRHGTGGSAPTNGGAHLVCGTVSGAGKFDGKFVNNQVGVSGIPFSGAGNGADALRVFTSGNAGTAHGTTSNHSRFLIQGNTIKRYGETGIQINARQGTGVMDATVLGNTINEPGTAAAGAFAAIWVNAGALAPDTNTVNVAIGSNSIGADKNTMQDSDPSNATDVFLDKNSCGSCASTLNLYRNGSGATGSGEALVRQILVDDNNATLDLLAGFTNGSTIGVQSGLPLTPP